MNIEVSHEENLEVFDALVSKLRQFNMNHMGDETSKPLSVIATDDQGSLIGGVCGRTIYNQLLIDIVWVDESARQQGLGRSLMARAEHEAKSRGCVAAQVDTLSFQAPSFYQKLGFEVIGTVTDILNSPDRFFLVKKYR